MGKYVDTRTDIFSVFALETWIAEGINTYPDNFIAVSPGNEFLRVSVIPNGEGLNASSTSGILIIDIFTEFGNGPSRTFVIADLLDTYLSRKSVTAASGYVTQFTDSVLDIAGKDADNASLFRATYTIPFSYFGVQ
jgi:hypothetical protein